MNQSTITFLTYLAYKRNCIRVGLPIAGFADYLAGVWPVDEGWRLEQARKQAQQAEQYRQRFRATINRNRRTVIGG